MAQRRSSAFGRLLRRAMLPGTVLTVVALVGTYMVVGANGAVAYGKLQHQLVRRQAVLADLKARQAILANHVALLDPRRANPDMVDELVRKQLNVTNPDEVVVPLQ